MMKFKEEAERFAKQQGFNNISWIGEGGFGAAYETLCGKVIKITTDKEEFVMANKLIGKNNHNIAHVYQTNIINNEIMGIVLEKLDTKHAHLLFSHILIESEDQGCHFSEMDDHIMTEHLPPEAAIMINDIMAATEQSQDCGFDSHDIHQNNVGKKKDGSYAIFDQYTTMTKQQLTQEFNAIKSTLISKIHVNGSQISHKPAL
jgi:hypothetical protein